VNAAQFSCWIAKRHHEYELQVSNIEEIKQQLAELQQTSNTTFERRDLKGASSALTELAGHQEEHAACKKWCRCGYLSGARYRLFAYGPADATAIPKPLHRLLPHLNPDWFSCTRGC